MSWCEINSKCYYKGKNNYRLEMFLDIWLFSVAVNLDQNVQGSAKSLPVSCTSSMKPELVYLFLSILDI